MSKYNMPAIIVLLSVICFLLIYFIVNIGNEPATKQELTVHTLKVINRETGKLVLIFSDSLPDPIVNGKEVPRIFQTSGMLYFDNDGNEVGGLVQPKIDMKQSMFTMDYDNTDAFSIFKQQTDSTWRTGMVLFDKNSSEEFETKGSGGTPRVIMANDNKDAVIILRDTKGRDRILLMVDKNDTPVIQVLDSEGRVVKDLLNE
ncbi:MAG: hypothetical protein HLUCCX10_15320 [Algoriphagus marincola HL-49]|uniref:Uncharacterized protein n=1 Tax=Algoriphagus marincola HL-49 TaxID=1305737 RepID=A0A0P7YB79_9BACT|nr:MAG: hypothetical protein HLUCCX10_15320 [Algoriphagus marincola HL-49]